MLPLPLTPPPGRSRRCQILTPQWSSPTPPHTPPSPPSPLSSSSSSSKIHTLHNYATAGGMGGGGVETVVVVAEVLVLLSHYPPLLLPTPPHFYLDIQTHTSARAHTNTNATTLPPPLPSQCQHRLPITRPPTPSHSCCSFSIHTTPVHHYVISFAEGRIHTHSHTHINSHTYIYTHRTHGTTTTEPAAMGPGRERRKALFYPQTLPTTTALLYSTLLSLSSQKLVDPTSTTPLDRHEPLLLYIYI